MTGQRKWFRAKLYGWGWYPCSWEGWLVTLTFVALFALLAGNYPYFYANSTRLTRYFILILSLFSALLITCHRTGEKPRWGWEK